PLAAYTARLNWFVPSGLIPTIRNSLPMRSSLPSMTAAPTRNTRLSSPVTVKESPKVAPRVAPGLGEHTDQVLEELGFDANQREELRTNRAIPPAPHVEMAVSGDR